MVGSCVRRPADSASPVAAAMNGTSVVKTAAEHRHAEDDQGLRSTDPLGEFLAHDGTEAEERAATMGSNGCGPEGRGLGGHAATSFVWNRVTADCRLVTSEWMTSAPARIM